MLGGGRKLGIHLGERVGEPMICDGEEVKRLQPPVYIFEHVLLKRKKTGATILVFLSGTCFRGKSFVLFGLVRSSFIASKEVAKLLLVTLCCLSACRPCSS